MGRSVPGVAALLHRTSTRPKVSTQRATIAVTSDSMVTSARMATASAPQAAATSKTSSSRRAATSTWAPWSTNSCAITGPSPVLAPVMMATFPANRPSVIVPSLPIVVPGLPWQTPYPNVDGMG